MLKIPFVLFFASALFAQAADQAVSRDTWTENLKTTLPTMFCQSSSYFRQCFDVTSLECEEIAASATRICLSKFINELPDPINLAEDGGYWGFKVGECAGSTYDIVLSERARQTPSCRDPNNWQ